MEKTDICFAGGSLTDDVYSQVYLSGPAKELARAKSVPYPSSSEVSTVQQPFPLLHRFSSLLRFYLWFSAEGKMFKDIFYTIPRKRSVRRAERQHHGLKLREAIIDSKGVLCGLNAVYKIARHFTTVFADLDSSEAELNAAKVFVRDAFIANADNALSTTEVMHAAVSRVNFKGLEVAVKWYGVAKFVRRLITIRHSRLMGDVMRGKKTHDSLTATLPHIPGVNVLIDRPGVLVRVTSEGATLLMSDEDLDRLQQLCWSLGKAHEYAIRLVLAIDESIFSGERLHVLSLDASKAAPKRQ